MWVAGPRRTPSDARTPRIDSVLGGPSPGSRTTAAEIRVQTPDGWRSLYRTTKALASLAIYQGLPWLRGQDVNLRPLGYENRARRPHLLADVDINADQPA